MRRRASSRPVIPVSASVFSGPLISKVSDRVVRPSGEKSASYPAAAPAVVPISFFRLPSIACPAAVSPNFSADRRKRLEDGITARPALMAFAALSARPSQPTMGTNPRPKAVMSSTVCPPVVSGLMPDLTVLKNSVTGRDVLVPSARSSAAAPVSVRPWTRLTGAVMRPRPSSSPAARPCSRRDRCSSGTRSAKGFCAGAAAGASGTRSSNTPIRGSPDQSPNFAGARVQLLRLLLQQ